MLSSEQLHVGAVQCADAAGSAHELQQQHWRYLERRGGVVRAYQHHGLDRGGLRTVPVPVHHRVQSHRGGSHVRHVEADWTSPEVD